jgi:hypothetical protein
MVNGVFVATYLYIIPQITPEDQTPKMDVSTASGQENGQADPPAIARHWRAGQGEPPDPMPSCCESGFPAATTREYRGWKAALTGISAMAVQVYIIQVSGSKFFNSQ